VIHGLHSSIFIYYAKLPNKFLADVAEHGIHYLEKVRNPPVISLRKTKPFHLSKTDERAEIFTLLAKLFWYLRSGDSHVGYLNKHLAHNPIHNAVHPPFLCRGSDFQGKPIYDSIAVARGVPREEPEIVLGSPVGVAGEMDVERPETPIRVDVEGFESADSNSLASVEMEGIEGGETDGLSDEEMHE
jgi:hypothetical protein